MAEGQQAHWWQEPEQPSETSRQASERVALAATSVSEPELDTWAELEAEALRRSKRATVLEAESVSIYIDRSAALRQRRRDRIFTCLYMAWNLIFFPSLCWVAIARNWGHLELWVSVSIVMTCHLFNKSLQFFHYFKWRNEFLQTSEKPLIRLSPQGIRLGTPDYWDVMLSWNEIASIGTKRYGKYGRLEINDTKYISRNTLNYP